MKHANKLEQKHPFRQWKSWTIPGANVTLMGYSRSSDKTFFYIPEWKVCLDAGLAEGHKVDAVFLTHTHHDHSDDIEFLSNKDSGVDLFYPKEAEAYLSLYLRAKRELNHMAPFDPSLASECRMHGVVEGDTLPVGKKGQLSARVLKCEHKIPCVGYGFWEKKQRFTPELETLKLSMYSEGKQREFGQLIAQKRKEGLPVQEDFQQPLFAYIGDTHAKLFQSAHQVFEYPTIITECTYLDDKERGRADLNGHTLWSDLKPIILAHPQNLFVLIHFSLRYSDQEVVRFFEEEAKNTEGGLQNIVVWAHPESLLAEQHQGS